MIRECLNDDVGGRACAIFMSDLLADRRGSLRIVRRSQRIDLARDAIRSIVAQMQCPSSAEACNARGVVGLIM